MKSRHFYCLTPFRVALAFSGHSTLLSPTPIVPIVSIDTLDDAQTCAILLSRPHLKHVHVSLSDGKSIHLTFRCYLELADSIMQGVEAPPTVAVSSALRHMPANGTNPSSSLQNELCSNSPRKSLLSMFFHLQNMVRIFYELHSLVNFSSQATPTLTA